jgi:REP element-mobilizing transposase RayT
MTPEDYKAFESFLLETSRRSGVRLYAWCLMPNHFHLLIATPGGNVAQFMQRLLTRYARNFNKTHETVGHVFQGRYRAILCDKESYLLALVRYIHLNPIKVKKGSLASGPEEWPWSSHRLYVKNAVPEGMKGPMEEVLLRFGATLSLALDRYEAFVLEGLKNSRWGDFYKVTAKRFLGDDRFIEEMKRRNGEQSREKPRSLKRIKSLAEFISGTASLFGVEHEHLRSPRRERALSRVRKALVHVGRRYYRFSAKELASSLGRDISAVSQVERRLGEKAETLPEVQRLLDSLRVEV